MLQLKKRKEGEETCWKLSSGELLLILSTVSREPSSSNERSLAALFHTDWIQPNFDRKMCWDFGTPSPLFFTTKTILEKGWDTKYLRSYLKSVFCSFHQLSPCPLASMCSKFLSLRVCTKTTVWTRLCIMGVSVISRQLKLPAVDGKLDIHHCTINLIVIHPASITANRPWKMCRVCLKSYLCGCH